MGPYLVDYKWAGQFTEEITHIVMDNVLNRERQKLSVKVIRTSVPNIWIGTSTVAVFKIKRKDGGILQKVSGELEPVTG